MKYGIREICDVVLRAKAKMNVGNKTFYKDEPVIYFDSLKTSSLEGAATTVYAQGGRGNSRLIAWEGEKTITFTMEDALISPMGLAILTGAEIVNGASGEEIMVHATENVEYKNGAFTLGEEPAEGVDIYAMVLDDYGNVVSEPYICTAEDGKLTSKNSNSPLPTEGVLLVDYYVKRANAVQFDITPDSFGGNFYLEAATLFRDTNGQDKAAEFIIPNCKVQSNFTFTMSSSGDPSTFTFTMDAFPDYTRFNKTKKVLSVLQIVEDDDETTEEETRTATPAV